MIQFVISHSYVPFCFPSFAKYLKYLQNFPAYNSNLQNFYDDLIKLHKICLESRLFSCEIKNNEK